jgi:hypothetical protein
MLVKSSQSAMNTCQPCVHVLPPSVLIAGKKKTITHKFSHGILADDCTLINDLQSPQRRAHPVTKVDPIEAMNLNLFRNLHPLPQRFKHLPSRA